MAYKKPFNAWNTMPTPPINEPYPPEVHRSVKSVNLMCFLLENVTYDQLYKEPFGYAIGEIAKQADLLDAPANDALLNKGAYTDTFDLKKVIFPALNEIKGYVHPTTKLGNLFTAIYTSGSVRAERKIFVRLNRLYREGMNRNGDCEVDHFCCPFRLFQQRGRRLDPQHLTDFLDVLGHKKMVQLYTEKKTDYSREEIRAICKARKEEILIDHSSRPLVGETSDEDGDTGVGLFSVNPFANGLTCDNGTCEELGNTSHWCNDADGSCSAASNP
ncbi:MAG: hypothetical protein L3K26_05820 [Candidatus Hydrogenedentes bacterium]|nr:hypothetical protein [Candidatus Hydrogenedentota bacterium]